MASGSAHCRPRPATFDCGALRLRQPLRRVNPELMLAPRSERTARAESEGVPSLAVDADGRCPPIVSPSPQLPSTARCRCNWLHMHSNSARRRQRSCRETGFQTIAPKSAHQKRQQFPPRSTRPRAPSLSQALIAPKTWLIINYLSEQVVSRLGMHEADAADVAAKIWTYTPGSDRPSGVAFLSPSIFAVAPITTVRPRSPWSGTSPARTSAAL